MTPPARCLLAAQLLAVGLLHGAVCTFDSLQEEWSEYAERFVPYFIANDIEEEEKRRVIFLNAVGSGTYRLLKTLASPQKVDKLSFSEIVELAATHFNPNHQALKVQLSMPERG